MSCCGTSSYVDFTGVSLYVGAEVAFIENGYRSLKRGTVIKLNPKKVTLEFLNWRGQKETTLRMPAECVRIG